MIWMTLAVTLLLLVALIRNWAPPDVVFVTATVVLVLIGAIAPSEAFVGFSNSGVITVAALFVVAAALRETGVLDFVGHHLLGKARDEHGAFGRLAAFVLPMSAFLNNTPLVAMLLPPVIDWCRKKNIAPSRLLIPLSYLAILGGTCTLIGTSTNLVIHGLMVETHQELLPQVSDEPDEAAFVEGLRGMNLFELAPIGIPYALIGTVYLALFGRWLLPDRKELFEQLGESRREYLVEMLVEPNCRLIGQTLEQAGLRQLAGLFLIEIDRKGRVLSPISPEEVIEARDRLVFTGVVSNIVDLEKIPGLVPIADPAYQLLSRDGGRQLCEAVVSSTSPLVGKSVREADFRAQYNAAVVAVHRNGARVTNKVGAIKLEPGDTLLLQTTPHFVRAHRNSTDFYLVSHVRDWRPLRRERASVALVLFALLLVLMIGGWVAIHIAAMLVAALMILSGCISPGDARESIEWQVLITIASAFAVSAALENSGAVEQVTDMVVDGARTWGPVAALAGIYLLTSLLTAVITNNAAAVLLFPFCLETARLLEVSPRPFLMALVLAASASFITPIGYQTNMMVYGPGGYRFSDFMRAGLPLNLVLWGVAVLMIPWIWPF